MRCEKFPVRCVWFTYGQPGMLDGVGATVQPPGLLRLESQWGGRDQDVCIWPMHRRHFAAHVLETALPGFYVEVGGIRDQVLRVHVHLDMAARRTHVSFCVVLHVVGAQPIALVQNFDLAVRKKYVAFLALLFGLQSHRSVAGGPPRPLPFTW